MAVGYDNSTYNSVTSSTSNTFSHTCAAGATALFVGVYGYVGTCTGVTYNGVAMTKVGSTQNPIVGELSLWKLANPTSGANNVVASVTTNSQINCVAASYTGTDTTDAVDSFATSYLNSAAASITQATTVVASNCWLAGFCIIDNSGTSSPSQSSNRTDRKAGGISPYYRSYAFSDSNGTVATGSQSIQFTDTGSPTYYKTAIVFSIKEPSSTAWTKTLSDTTSLTDTILRSPSRFLSEITTLTASMIRSLNRAFSEVVTTTASMLRTATRILTETFTNTDTFLGMKIIFSIRTETLTMVDTLIKQTVRTLSETITTTASMLRNATRVFTETITTTATFISLRTRTAILLETITNSDTLIRLEQRVLSEITTLTATLISLRLRVATLTETITNTDTLLRLPSRILSEVVSLADTLLKTASRTLSEVITLVSIAIQMGNKVLSETITTTDTLLKVLGKTYTETISFADQVIIRLNGIVTNLWSKVARTIDSWNKVDRD